MRDVDVFLFDEPLSNLDAKLRSELRVEIKRLHQRLDNTMIYVTHDQIEAMTLADRIAVMKGGVIQQLDTPQAIYNRPVNRFVAGFIGSPGDEFHRRPRRRRRRSRRSAPAMSPCRSAATCFDNGGRPAGAVALGIRPEHIVYGPAAAGQPFSKEIEVEIVEPMGSDTLVWTKLGGHNLSFRVEAEKALSVGERIADRFRPGARLALRRRQRANGSEQ